MWIRKKAKNSECPWTKYDSTCCFLLPLTTIVAKTRGNPRTSSVMVKNMHPIFENESMRKQKNRKVTHLPQWLILVWPYRRNNLITQNNTRHQRQAAKELHFPWTTQEGTPRTSNPRQGHSQHEKYDECEHSMLELQHVAAVAVGIDGGHEDVRYDHPAHASARSVETVKME